MSKLFVNDANTCKMKTCCRRHNFCTIKQRKTDMRSVELRFIQFSTSRWIYVRRMLSQVCNIDCLMLGLKYNMDSVLLKTAIPQYSMNATTILHDRITGNDHAIMIKYLLLKSDEASSHGTMFASQGWWRENTPPETSRTVSVSMRVIWSILPSH